MNPFDIFIAVIISFCLIRGIFRGIIKGASSLIGVLSGFYAAYTYHTYGEKFLAKWIFENQYNSIISFMVIFCGVFIAIHLLGILIKHILKIASFGWMDRTLGALAGVIIGVLVISVVLFALTTFLPKGAPLIKNSTLAPYAILVSEKLSKAVPKNLKQRFVTNLGEVKKIWKK